MQLLGSDRPESTSVSNLTDLQSQLCEPWRLRGLPHESTMIRQAECQHRRGLRLCGLLDEMWHLALASQQSLPAREHLLAHLEALGGHLSRQMVVLLWAGCLPLQPNILQ